MGWGAQQEYICGHGWAVIGETHWVSAWLLVAMHSCSPRGVPVKSPWGWEKEGWGVLVQDLCMTSKTPPPVVLRVLCKPASQILGTDATTKSKGGMGLHHASVLPMGPGASSQEVREIVSKIFWEEKYAQRTVNGNWKLLLFWSDQEGEGNLGQKAVNTGVPGELTAGLRQREHQGSGIWSIFLLKSWKCYICVS